MVPETNYSIAESFYCFRARCVRRLRVLSPVQFDYEPRVHASKVSYMRTDRKLTLEFSALKAAAAQILPKTMFRIRAIVSQLARDRGQPFFRQSLTPSPQPSPHWGEGVRACLIPIFLASALTGCVTARMHTQAELNDVGQNCGLALGELFQDESEKRLIFLFRPDSTPQERSCVAKFARKNGLKAVFVNAVNLPAS